ncbi:hypothetical protein QTP88_007522 [Uroleucon formosanum]
MFNDILILHTVISNTCPVFVVVKFKMRICLKLECILVLYNLTKIVLTYNRLLIFVFKSLENIRHIFYKRYENDYLYLIMLRRVEIQFCMLIFCIKILNKNYYLDNDKIIIIKILEYLEKDEWPFQITYAVMTNPDQMALLSNPLTQTNILKSALKGLKNVYVILFQSNYTNRNPMIVSFKWKKNFIILFFNDHLQFNFFKCDVKYKNLKLNHRDCENFFTYQKIVRKFVNLHQDTYVLFHFKSTTCNKNHNILLITIFITVLKMCLCECGQKKKINTFWFTYGLIYYLPCFHQYFITWNKKWKLSIISLPRWLHIKKRRDYTDHIDTILTFVRQNSVQITKETVPTVNTPTNMQAFKNVLKIFSCLLSLKNTVHISNKFKFNFLPNLLNLFYLPTGNKQKKCTPKTFVNSFTTTIVLCIVLLKIVIRTLYDLVNSIFCNILNVETLLNDKNRCKHLISSIYDYEEILSDDDFSNSDLDSDIVVESEHNTCTEESGLSSDENESSDQNYSNMFGFTKDMTLVSHVPKKSKIVLLLSKMHHDNAIDSNLNKPEIITFYNMTKGGVDVVDALKGNYSVARISRRWPLTIFYSLLNIAGINSQLIYEANNNCNINRREFLQTLGKKLTMGYLQQRTNIKTLPIEVKQKIASILGEKYIEQSNIGPTREGRCYHCDRKKNRKTKTQYKNCENYICLQSSEADACVFEINNNKIILAIFADDGLIAKDNKDIIEDLLTKLETEFEVKMGNLEYFLGMQVDIMKNWSLFVYQKNYACSIINKFNMVDTKEISIPIDKSHTLDHQKVPEILNEEISYKQAVGSLLFFIS